MARGAPARGTALPSQLCRAPGEPGGERLVAPEAPVAVNRLYDNVDALVTAASQFFDRLTPEAALRHAT